MDHSEVKHLPKVDHTPAELDAASKLLLKAADYVEKNGWCQHELQSGDGRVCIVGALSAVADEIFLVGTHSAAWTRLQKALNKMAGTWNDTQGRTKEEVVAKLRAVALGL
jgi:hypothetical protein